MTNTIIKSRYSPKYKLKSRKILPEIDYSTRLPPNLQNFKDELFSGSGFKKYEHSSKTSGPFYV